MIIVTMTWAVDVKLRKHPEHECLSSLPVSHAYLYRKVIARYERKQWGQLLAFWWRCIRATRMERSEYFFFRGYYAAGCNAAFPVVRAVTTYTFSIRISTVVWPCQISIIGCPFRPTDGCSRNDVITNKSASMLLPGKIAGQSVYLLDDTDIEIVILVHGHEYSQ